jgi:hypothetical protein
VEKGAKVFWDSICLGIKLLGVQIKRIPTIQKAAFMRTIQEILEDLLIFSIIYQRIVKH